MVIFAPLAREIYRRQVVTADDCAAARKGIVFPDACLPEPAERLTYVVGSLLVPALIFALTIMMGRGFRSRPVLGELRRRSIIIAEISQIALLGGGLVYLWFALRGDHISMIDLNLIGQRPWISIPVGTAALAATLWLNSSSRAARWIGGLAMAVPTIAIVLSSIIGPHNYYAASCHFYAVFDPQVHVSLGRDLLVDYQSQYGLFPDFLAPVFATIGLSVSIFSLTMGLLTAASFGLLGWVLRAATARRGLAVAGYLALLFNGWLLFQLRAEGNVNHFFDLYFQYLPLRLIGPALGVVWIWAYHTRPTRRRYWAAHICLSLGVLWNPDSGVIALAAWLSALVYEALFADDWRTRARRITLDLASTVSTLAATVLAYSAVKFVWYGAWPDLRHIVDYPRLFYGTGFFMLPMPWWGGWQAVIAIYLAGFALAASALTDGRRSPRNTLIMAVSVMGLGLFSYYQGRSHEMCLVLCWWPAILLLPIYCDQLMDLLRESPRRRWFARGLAWTTGAFVVCSAASLAINARRWYSVSSEQLAAAFWRGSPLAADIQAIREKSASGQDVFILSRHAPCLHLATGRVTPAPAALNQMLWTSQWEELASVLDRRERSLVFIDRSCADDMVIGPKRNLGTRLFLANVTPRLRLVAETTHGRLYELQPLTIAASVVHGAAAAPPEIRYWQRGRDGQIDRCAPFENPNLKEIDDNPFVRPLKPLKRTIFDTIDRDSNPKK